MANVLESLTNVLRALANHSEIQKQTHPQVFDNIDHSVVTGRKDMTERVLQGAKQKPEKPLGEDGGLCPCCYTSALVL